jgi:hypothetical protein
MANGVISQYSLIINPFGFTVLQTTLLGTMMGVVFPGTRGVGRSSAYGDILIGADGIRSVRDITLVIASRDLAFYQ